MKLIERSFEVTMLENDLVPIYTTDTGEKVVYGTELHSALNVRTDFSTWIKRRISECDAEESVDYTTCSPNLGSGSNGGQNKIEYIIKLDAAKEMAMLERNDKVKQVRRYFIEVEKKYKKQKTELSSLSPELQRAYAILESQAKMELEQKRQVEQIELLQNDVKEIEARVTTHEENYYTIAGYSSLRGLGIDINKANMLGRKARKRSDEYGYDVGRVKDPRFGTANTYHVDILKEVFSEYRCKTA